MRRLLLALLLLLAAGSARAQLSTQCPLAARLQHGNTYTVSTADQCYWVVLDASGVISVTVPSPSSTFLSGYTVTLVPIGSGTLTLTVLPDPQTGTRGVINNVNPLPLVAGQQIELRVGSGPNWYGLIASNLSALSFGSPPAIGNVTPNTGAFTILNAASEVVSGGITAGALSASTLALTGSLTSNITGPGPQCVHASSSGILSGTGTDCGSGGGGGGTSNVFVGNTTGPANTYTMAVTVPGAFTLTDQFVVRGTISATNTGASVLNVGGTGFVAIDKQTPTGFTAVATGDLVGHLEYDFTYNAASGVFVVTNNTSVGTIPAPVNGDVIYGVGGVWTATSLASFGYITGNQTITLSGDTAGSGATAITTTTAKVNGVSYGTSPATNTVPVITSANTATYEAVPNAALANSAITINSHSTSLGGSVTLAFTDFAGAITAAQMLALQSGYVYYGNLSNQPVPTPLSTLFASPPALGGSSAAAVNTTNLTIAGTITTPISGGGLQCLHVNNSGVVSGTAADCSGAAGSGTVNAGTTNQVAYYPGNASTVGGENTLTLPQTHPATRAGQIQAMMRSFGAL
jgi:hypothetical protein